MHQIAAYILIVTIIVASKGVKASTNTTVSPLNTTALQYSPGWGYDNIIGEAFTQGSANHANALFPFNGVQVFVSGWIDAGLGSQMTLEVDGVDSSMEIKNSIRTQLYWTYTSPMLLEGSHSLTINFTTSSSGGPPAGLHSLTVSKTGNSSQPNNGTSSTIGNSKFSPGIIGGLVTAIILTLISASLAFFYYRRARRSNDTFLEVTQDMLRPYYPRVEGYQQRNWFEIDSNLSGIPPPLPPKKLLLPTLGSVTTLNDSTLSRQQQFGNATSTGLGDGPASEKSHSTVATAQSDFPPPYNVG